MRRWIMYGRDVGAHRKDRFWAIEERRMPDVLGEGRPVHPLAITEDPNGFYVGHLADGDRAPSHIINVDLRAELDGRRGGTQPLSPRPGEEIRLTIQRVG